MKDYAHFSVNDFASDEFFQDWIVRPAEATNTFWEQWLSEHPEKGGEVREARALIESLNFPHFRLSDGDVEDLWKRIKRS